MPTIFHVLSNLNHSGDIYKKGEFMEADLDTFKHLVTDGVLRVVEGAKTIKEASKIIEREQVKAEEIRSAVVAPRNTWGPQKDEEEVPEKEDVIDDIPPGEVGKGDVPPTAQSNTKIDSVKKSDETGDNL